MWQALMLSNEIRGNSKNLVGKNVATWGSTACFKPQSPVVQGFVSPGFTTLIIEKNYIGNYVFSFDFQVARY